MNQILTLKDITAIVTRETGIDAQRVEAIIKAWIDSTGEEIAITGSSVTKALGRFYTEGRGIQFDPTAEIAATVNAPFALFEPVEAATGVLPEVKMAPDSAVYEPNVVEEATTVEEVPASVEEIAPETEETVTEVEAFTPDPETQTEPEPKPQISETKTENQVITTPATVLDYDKYNIYDDEEDKSGTSPWLYFLWGFVSGLIIACVAVYILYPPLHYSNKKIGLTQQAVTEDVTTQVETTDTILDETNIKTSDTPTATATTRPLTTVVTDTVSSTRFLATMAREYYGNMVFWVYIYEENSDILGHPDRIAPGTVVVIPPAAKYNIDPNSQASINSASAIIPRLYEPYR